MSGWFFVPIIWMVSWLEGAPPRVSIQFCCFFLAIYYVMRIFANLFMDRDGEIARVENNRRHFGRPAFRMWNDKDGLHVESGPNPDHATRCQNSLRDWYAVERRLKWNNWIYGALAVLFWTIMNHV